MKPFSLFILFTLSTLCATAQPTVERDSSIYVTSSRLYRMGESLIVSMQVDVTRTLSANESVVLVPQLSDSLGNFMQLPAIYINGRKQHIVFQRETGRHEKKYEEIRRNNNLRQTLRYLRPVPFTPWMEGAHLTLIEKACGCGVPVHTDSTYLTRLHIPRLYPQVAFITPPVEEVKLREESGSAFLHFPLNETTINREYHHNAAELAKIAHSIHLVKNDTNAVISRIDIHGYASPEGPYAINERLAGGRTRALKEYVCSRYALADSLLHVSHTAEDWDGLIRLLNDTVFPHRNELLRIAGSKDAPDKKEQKIRKQYPDQFSFLLQHGFPVLRRSDYTIHYVVRPFTVEQAKEVFRTQPKNLSIDEMFRIAQTYAEGSAAYNKVFMTAVLLNPEHPIANHNAACIALKQGDTDSAESYLAKSPESPEKTLALGVLHLLKGEYKEAEAKLREAENEGLEQATENLKLLQHF